MLNGLVLLDLYLLGPRVNSGGGALTSIPCVLLSYTVTHTQPPTEEPDEELKPFFSFLSLPVSLGRW